MIRLALLFAGIVLVAPALTLASAQTPPKAATHSTSGVVQSFTDTSLVIARVGKGTKNSATEAFVINGTTVKNGSVVVGAKVGVRYVTEGGKNVATAVTVTAKLASTGHPLLSR